MAVEKLETEVTREINNVDTVTFQLKPVHMLSANAQISIKLPDEFSLVPSVIGSVQVDCKYTGISSNMQKIMQDCQYIIIGGVKQVIISNALIMDYTNTSVIRFKVHNMKLPPSEAPTGNFEYTVSTGYAGAYYPVDTKIINQLFLATRAAFGYGTIMTASIVAD